MFNDIDWTKKRNSAEFPIPSRVSDYAKEFPRGHWSFLGPGNGQSSMGRVLTNQKENGTSKPIRRLISSKKVVIPYSAAQVPSTEEY